MVSIACGLSFWAILPFGLSGRGQRLFIWPQRDGWLRCPIHLPFSLLTAYPATLGGRLPVGTGLCLQPLSGFFVCRNSLLLGLFLRFPYPLDWGFSVGDVRQSGGSAPLPRGRKNAYPVWLFFRIHGLRSAARRVGAGIREGGVHSPFRSYSALGGMLFAACLTLIRVGPGF